MARNKQTGPEIKLYQIDTMVYLGTKNIITKLSMFAEFLKEDGVAVADKLQINRARALERFDKNYKISDIEELSIDGQANETWLRKNGLLNSVGGCYELSPLAIAILKEEISLSEYCFLLLSKQWIKVNEPGKKNVYKENLLSVILADLQKCGAISKNDFVSHVGNLILDKYKDDYDGLSLSNQEAARFLIEPLLISKIIVENKDDYIINPGMLDLVEDYVNNSSFIQKIDEVECTDEEYWNNLRYGFYDIITQQNKTIYTKYYPNLFKMNILLNNQTELPLQQIFYGAPGTGKSHEINIQTEGEEVIRTTFHPDSDYSTFVGAYKPTSIEVEMRDVTGRVIQDANGPITENRIIYKFVEQAFLQAYIQAWTAYANASEDDEVKKQYLVIEEINRGNCAQIFGDLFQLLDRNDAGFSEYPIKADNDMKKQLSKAFSNLQIAKADEINSCYNGKDIVKEVLNGECLLLPNNLYIWATMNTSDQSLFPIDSAFKRRWDWKYMPIDTAKENWTIRVNGTEYSWTSFLNIINEIIQEKTQSEDKQLGFYFCKAKDNIIDAETFVGKVLFYLWNDVFKDYGFDDDFFADEKLDDGSFKPISFKSFYDVKTRKVIEAQAEKFLKNLKVEENGVYITEDPVDEDNGVPGLADKKLKFWTGFNVARKGNVAYSNIYNERTAAVYSSMDLSFGSSLYWPTMAAVFTKKLIRCGIFIGKSPQKDSIFNAFKQHEEEINMLVGSVVSFEIKPNTYALNCERSFDLDDESTWPEAYEWLMSMAIKMKEVKEKYGI